MFARKSRFLFQEICVDIAESSVPAAQIWKGRQFVLPPTAYVPAAHSVHTVSQPPVMFLNVPGGQGRQEPSVRGWFGSVTPHSVR